MLRLERVAADELCEVARFVGRRLALRPHLYETDRIPPRSELQCDLRTGETAADYGNIVTLQGSARFLMSGCELGLAGGTLEITSLFLGFFLDEI
jgi:hypothetical protein